MEVKSVENAAAVSTAAPTTTPVDTKVTNPTAESTVNSEDADTKTGVVDADTKTTVDSVDADTTSKAHADSKSDSKSSSVSSSTAVPKNKKKVVCAGCDRNLVIPVDRYKFLCPHCHHKNKLAKPQSSSKKGLPSSSRSAQSPGSAAVSSSPASELKAGVGPRGDSLRVVPRPSVSDMPNTAVKFSFTSAGVKTLEIAAQGEGQEFMVTKKKWVKRWFIVTNTGELSTFDSKNDMEAFIHTNIACRKKLHVMKRCIGGTFDDDLRVVGIYPKRSLGCAGVKRGDVLTSLDNQPLIQKRDFGDVYMYMRVGDTAPITMKRKNKKLSGTVVIGGVDQTMDTVMHLTRIRNDSVRRALQVLSLTEARIEKRNDGEYRSEHGDHCITIQHQSIQTNKGLMCIKLDNAQDHVGFLASIYKATEKQYHVPVFAL